MATQSEDYGAQEHVYAPVLQPSRAYFDVIGDIADTWKEMPDAQILELVQDRKTGVFYDPMQALIDLAFFFARAKAQAHQTLRKDDETDPGRTGKTPHLLALREIQHQSNAMLVGLLCVMSGEIPLPLDRSALQWVMLRYDAEPERIHPYSQNIFQVCFFSRYDRNRIIVRLSAPLYAASFRMKDVLGSREDLFGDLPGARYTPEHIWSLFQRADGTWDTEGNWYGYKRVCETIALLAEEQLKLEMLGDMRTPFEAQQLCMIPVWQARLNEERRFLKRLLRP